MSTYSWASQSGTAFCGFIILNTEEEVQRAESIFRVSEFCCMKKLSIFLVSCVAGILAACGGGGNGGDNSASVQYTVSTRAGIGGSITPASRSVDRNATATFSLVPEAGYSLASASGCGGTLTGGTLTGTTYVTGAITGDCTVSAQFVAATYALGGNVSGLDGTLELLLRLPRGTETLALATNGNFTFDTRAGAGESYEVTIQSAPATQLCRVLNGFGEVSADVNNINIDCIAESATATLAGRVMPAASIGVDSDINDGAAPPVDNSSFSQAQPIHNRITLNGFASARPTLGDGSVENFALSSDSDDFYSVTLAAGQRIRLQVVDYEGFAIDALYQGDLDLYLYNASAELIGVSESESEFEELVVPSSGDYFINVLAFSGISKYVLRLYPPESSAVAIAATAEQIDFVADQMIVKRAGQSAAVLGKSARVLSKMTFSHDDRGRAALAKVNSDLRALAVPGRAMRELARLNPASHAKVRTLRNIKTVRQQPGVIYAEPNYIRHALRTPNDPGYSYQWHYEAISLPEAWDITTGQGVAGDVIVAVIDTGVLLDHEDLSANLVAGYDFVSSPEQARDGDGIDASADDPGDSEARGQSSWHGTHVTGTIAAASNNFGGVTGVSWGARVMPIRVLGEGGGTSYDVIQGLRYAAGLSNDSGTVPARRADVANLSLGGPSGSLAEQEAYREARAMGMIIVAAAGNEDTSTASYPAAYDSVISVSATDARNQRAPYSNFGPSVAVAAPGGNMAVDANGNGYPDGIFSTLVDDTSGTRQSSYNFYQGTSMAAPHVSGVIALMKAVYPDLTPDTFDNILESGAITDDLGASGRDDFYGYGLINAFKAVQVAQELASGGEIPEAPPQVVSTPSIVDIESGENTATIELSNRGGGDPAITSVTTDVDWLSVVPETIDANGLGTYRIAVDTGQLEDGFHAATITFAVNDGSRLRVQVNVQIGPVSVDGTLPPIYVLLLDSVTQEVVDAVAADQTDGTYSFSDVPTGEYLITGGSDIDVDNFVCQSGEACGGYPTLSSQQVVRVEGVDMSGLDFVADILGAFSSSETNAIQGQQNPGIYKEKLQSGKTLPD